jgi:hypothetical protein
VFVEIVAPAFRTELTRSCGSSAPASAPMKAIAKPPAIADTTTLPMPMFGKASSAD